MDDLHSRAYGLAHSVILEEILRAMLKNGTLTAPELRGLLERSGSTLLSMKTEVSAAASAHVQILGETLGLSPGHP